jgi:O-antigen/teichoic acid export membrane protein
MDINSKNRYKNSIKTSLMSFAEQGLFYAVQLIAIPLTLPYLGEERFGVWMILTSFIAIISISDFGIQFGLQNLVASAFGKNETKSIQRYVSNATLVFVIIGASIILISNLAIPNIDVTKIVNVNNKTYYNEIENSALILFIAFGISIPLSIGNVILIAHQKGYIHKNFLIVRNVLAFILIVLFAKLQLGLPWLLSGIWLFPISISFIQLIYVFFIKYRQYSPRLRYISLSGLKHIIRSGSGFFGLQLLSLFANNLDVIIVAQTMNATAVAVYSITSKIFRPIVILVNIIIRPLWPAFTEAKAKNDWAWVKFAFLLSLGIGTVLSVILGLPIYIWGEQIIHYWSKTEIEIPVMLLSGFYMMTIATSIKYPLINFLNGMNRLKTQLIYQAVFTVVGFFLKVWLGKKYGSSGVIWGAVLATFGILIWAQLIDSYYTLRRKGS